MLTLVLGGNRSGKSRYAEQCAKKSVAKQIYYIATALADDEEMRQRVVAHQQFRPKSWHTIETSVKLASTLLKYAKPEHCLLVDCLTLWLSNVMFDERGNIQQTLLDEELAALLHSLEKLPGDIILVSNEIGSGVIAMDKSTRRFVDQMGLLHQQLAAISNRVVLVTAGLPQVLKS